MTAQQIVILFLGWLAYMAWQGKAVLNGDNHIATIKEFLLRYGFDIVISIIAVVFVAIAAPSLPKEWISLDKPLNIFIAGGAAPSMITTVISAFKRR
jgi:hypothetical protein